MGQIDGKQIKDTSIVEGKLATAFTDELIRRDGSIAYTGDQPMGNNKITGLATPTAAGDAATKAYVDALSAGLDPKESCRAATIAALPANTAAGSGVGKTLTADANGALIVDGVTMADNDRLLVQDEVTGADNGIYDVTDKGSAGTPYILTRSTDADQDIEVTAGMFTFIEEGTVNADAGFVLSTNDPITVDTTSLAFTQFSGAGAIVAGAGLTKSGSTIDVGENAAGAIKVNADDIEVITDDVTIEDDGSASPAKLRVKDAGIDENKLNTSVAGNGLTGGGGSALTVGDAGKGVQVNAADVQVDASEIAGDGLQQKTGGGNEHTIEMDLKAAGGLKIDTAELAVEPNDFAGTGIEDDGSDNLQLSTQGNGIAGGGGSTLSVLAEDDSIVVGGSGVKAATPTTSNKDMTANVTTSDNDQATATVIVAAPAGASGRAYVQVFVNGVKVLVGDGTKTSVDGYFSGDAGTTARAFDAIVNPDTFHWNGSVAGYELATTDRIDFDYTVA